LRESEVLKRKYKWNASDYDKHSSVQLEWARELIQKLNLQGSESVLDIGCGDGKVTAEIAQCLSDGCIIGVENSEEMIGLASRKFPEIKFPNLQFKKMDAGEITFKNPFDVVFSNAALHWIRDHQPVLNGVAGCLKKLGRLLFQMGGRGNAEGIIAVINRLIETDPWKPYFKHFTFPYGFYDPDIYRDWLAQAGLKEKRIELVPKNMLQKGKEGLAGWIRTTWLPYTEQVPEHLRDILIEDVVNRYLKDYPFEADGWVCVRMVRLEVEAVKL
jgi:trans-aconitate 2-methyltransferase